MLSEPEIRSRLQPLAPLPTGVRPKQGRISPIRCILFDIYGTLFISASGDIGIARRSNKSLRKLKSLLSKYRIGQPPEDLLARYYQSIEADHHASKEKGIEFPEVDIIRIWKQVLDGLSAPQLQDFAVEFEILANPTYPMPNLSDMLRACRKSGVRMGLISNAQFYTPLLFEWFLDANTEDLGFDHRLVFYSFQHGQAKPGEYLYRLAAKQLGRMEILPSVTLYVGNDMLNDIHPAKNTGFLTALFAGDARSLRLREDDPRCALIQPDLVVTELNQLIPHLPEPAP